jgi:hypothetical protein
LAPFTFPRRFPPTGYAETGSSVQAVSEERTCRVEEGQCPSSSCSPRGSRRSLRSCLPPAQAESSTRAPCAPQAGIHKPDGGRTRPPSVFFAQRN